MNSISKIEQFITQHNLIKQNTTIVLGLSGGPDSVFLLHFLANLQKKGIISLITAHLDHEWRKDSSKDEQFCREISEKCGIEFARAKISELSAELKFNGSKEEYGRKMRRYFLEKIAKEKKTDCIALAHHLQDQEETFFIRLIRGSSLTGLTAMRPKHGMYIRPLLEINKNDIITWLQKNNIDYLTDPSNESPEFLRNRIRNTVLPALQKCDKRFDSNFLLTLNRLKETENFLEHLTQKTFESISHKDNDIFIVNINQFINLEPTMQYRTILYWLISENVPFSPTQAFLDEIVRFLLQPEGKTHAIHEKWSIVKKQKKAFIKK